MLCRLAVLGFCALIALALPATAIAQNAAIPTWLQPHVGYEDGKIAPIVLTRARALHQDKMRRGKVRNPCYLAMDATRPSTGPSGAPARRFYTICEKARIFRASSSGYGNGRKLSRANFSNGRTCAKNFSNAEGSKLTMGGAYVTAESRTSFKGMYRQGSQIKPFYRTFLLFDGEKETRNARGRAIGGHQAMFLKWQCRMKVPNSRHADENGFVPFGRLVDYTSGRSNGCTTWSGKDTVEILKRVDGNPTTLYIYPESRDINAVAQVARAGGSLAQQGLYWNASCLKEIGAPRFWPKRELQPVINQWRRSLPKHQPRELPICK